MTRRAVAARPDVLVVTTPPLALSLSAILLSRMWKIPFIQHVPDLQPDAAVDLGMLRAGRLTDCLYGLERMGYRKAALVSTLTEAMRDKIVSKGIRGREGGVVFGLGPIRSYSRCRPMAAVRSSGAHSAWVMNCWSFTPATWESSKGSK